MRRVLLGAFLFLAACGGDLRSQAPGAINPSTDARAERAQFLMTSAAQQAIAEFAKSSSQDALDTCVNTWVDEPWGADDLGGEFKKPSVASLRSFLSRCLATTDGDAGADLRTPRISEMKAVVTSNE
jgi:hypothetical protein